MHSRKQRAHHVIVRHIKHKRLALSNQTRHAKAKDKSAILKSKLTWDCKMRETETVT